MPRAVKNQLLTGSLLNNSMEAKMHISQMKLLALSSLTTPVLRQATYQHGRMEGREHDYE